MSMTQSLHEQHAQLQPSHHAFHPMKIDGRYQYRLIGKGLRDADRKGIIIELKSYPDGWPPDGRITLRKIEHSVDDIPWNQTSMGQSRFLAWAAIPMRRKNEVRYRQIGFAYLHADKHGLEVYLDCLPLNGFVYVRHRAHKPDSWTKK